jgi:hypothetical protein
MVFPRMRLDARPLVEPGVYLTDEVFLFRVVGLAVGGADGLLEIEDCYGLDVVRVPATDVRARGLRVVKPAQATA